MLMNVIDEEESYHFARYDSSRTTQVTKIEAVGMLVVLVHFQPAKAYTVQTLCENEFTQIPSVLQVLKSQFGKHPNYTYTPFDYAANEVHSISDNG